MTIEQISDRIDPTHSLNVEKANTQKGELSTHKIHKTASEKFANFGIATHIKPLMSRAPDHSRAELISEWDKENGAKLGFKWVWEWDDSKKKEDSAEAEGNQGTTSLEPPDSSCRDSDRDKHFSMQPIGY